MNPAAKHFDPLVGVDIHIIQPPGPVPPLPVPHPFVGMVIDPMEYAPYIGGTVKVNGMMRGVAGTGGKCLPPHIPIGGVFVKPPANEAEIFMGSQTVDFDGDPASYMALPALSCHDIGMPSPPRLKKHTKPKSLELPTTVVLPIPAGPPVLIGGPPTINIMGMLMKVGLKGLGKAFKKLKASKLGQKFAAIVKKAKQKAFKNMKPGFLKCVVLKAEPVNTITGEVVVEQRDFRLPGRIPIEWARTYGTHSDRPGLCGFGWQTPADARLTFESDGSVTFADGGMGITSFDSLPVNGSIVEEIDGAILTHDAELLFVKTKAGLAYYFPRPGPGVREVLVDAIRDRCKNPLYFVRDQGKLRSIVDNSGRRIEVKSRNGRIVEMALHHPKEPQPRVLVTYDYNAAGDLIAVYDPKNVPYVFTYVEHRLVKHSDSNGLTFSYEFDGSGKCVHTWGNGGLYDYRFEYDDTYQETRIFDSLGHKTTIQFDDRLLPINEIDALGGATSFEYDEFGRTIAVTDPTGNRTEYAYDERGNVLKYSLADGSSIAAEYDAENQPVKITYPNGVTGEQTWDPRGLLVQEKSPAGAAIKYEYDAHGQLQAYVDPRGLRTFFAMDAVGNPEAIIDALGNRTEYAYDVLGNVIRKTDPLGRVTAYSYDAKSRLVQTTLPSNATMQYAYNAQDDLIRLVDPNGAETRLVYCGLGAVAKRTDPDGHAVQFQYDTEERLIAVKNQRGETYRLVRDPLGRIVEEVDYWGQSRKYEYNASGHLRAIVDALGQRIEIATDALGRMLKKTMPNLDEEEFSYDAAGNLIGAKNAHGEVKREYDKDGQLVKEVQRDLFTIENRFDASGNRVERKTTLGQATVYAFDRLNLVESVCINEGAPLRMERDGAGQVVRETLPSGLTRQYGYSADGWLAEQSVSHNHRRLFSSRYEYDRVGNLLKREDSRLGVHSYRYDPLRRIVEHLAPQGRLERYLTDPAGDLLRTKTSTDGGTWRREGQFEGAAYRFDRVGNLVERSDGTGALELVWDANRRLVETRTRGNTTRYGYDPLGRRIFKESDGLRTLFFWDGHVFAGEMTLRGETPTRVVEYVCYPETFEPLARIGVVPAKSEVAWLVNEPNGCPARSLVGEGKIKWETDYTSWFKATKQAANPDECEIRLQGQYFDVETGLHYNHLRYFDPAIGQFVSQDPLGVDAGENVYQLAPNGIHWADPLGLNSACAKVALDTNALIALMERKGRQAVLDRIGNRRPIVSRTALREFAQGGGDVAGLKAFLKKNQGKVVRDAKKGPVSAEVARGLAKNDAKIVATARSQGAELLTRDDRVLSRVPDVAAPY
jgi:RHS repeat-associated protein